ncbi:MAG: light-harvesting protein [Devosiaceae bacterium]|nr:light-harvesting protein [Devosiaceae bacterium MH13]
MSSSDGGSLTGLSSEEAREFHRIFVKSAIAFTGWAFAAHVLVWLWRPWSLARETASVDMIEGVTTLAAMLPVLV